LRFVLEEAAAFLMDAMGLAAIPRMSRRWNAHEGGAGLQFAALAMRDRSDISGFITAFTGSIARRGYLAEESLSAADHLQTS